MQVTDELSSRLLQKRAIKAALNENWDEAIEINTEILSRDPKDIQAKIRLGRAYLQKSDFAKAKKFFKDVLALDPINQIALKNLEYAKNNKKIKSPASETKLIREPGTSHKEEFKLTNSKVTIDELYSGDELTLQSTKDTVSVYTLKGKLLGTINSGLAAKLKAIKAQKGTFEARFIGRKGSNIKILIKSSVSVFKSEKQEVRPYIKRGTIDSEDIEIE